VDLAPLGAEIDVAVAADAGVAGPLEARKGDEAADLVEIGREFVQLAPEGVVDLEVVGLMAAGIEERALAAEGVILPGGVDADGLNAIAAGPKNGAVSGPRILTPHPGEMAGLTGLDKDEIQADRLGVVERFAAEWGHVVVLKGACTLVAAPIIRS